MWNLSLPWWEFVLRAILVYVFLLLILRMTGKRQIGQMAPFDLVLLLVLSNAVQNSMNGGDNTISAGVILSITLIGLNSLVGFISFRSKKIERFVEGRPQVLIHNGHVYDDIMSKEKLTRQEIDSALRRAGVAAIEDVHFAILETNGDISVRAKNH